MRIDFESYNDNNTHGAKLEPFDYDMNKDLAESKLPSEYPEERPDDADDDEENGEQPPLD